MSSFNSPTLEPEPMLAFLLANNLERSVIAFTLMVDFSTEEVEERKLHCQVRHGDMERLWNQLFSVIDPLRFTIVAPPATLAALMNRMLFLTDAWSFAIPYHILSLARSSRADKELIARQPLHPSPGSSDFSERVVSSPSNKTGISTSKTHSENRGHAKRSSHDRMIVSLPLKDGPYHELMSSPASSLFTLRPWTSVLLNEGSSVRAYETYEYFLRQPPSMLDALLGTGEYPNNRPLLPRTIVDFNYIAVFPIASHVASLFDGLPKLDRLFLQLTPRPSNHILQDQKQMKHVDRADLWMERNTVYSQLPNELLLEGEQSNWRALKVFESGDAADKASWDMIVDSLQQKGVHNWIAERPGLLVKVNEDGTPAPSRATVAHHRLEQDESLGVARMLVSPPLPLRTELAEEWFSKLLAVARELSDPDNGFAYLLGDRQAAEAGLRTLPASVLGRGHRVHRTQSGEYTSDMDIIRSLGL